MKGPRHRDGQPESTVERHGLRFKVDRHDGTVIDGVGHDGKPYHVVQKGDYGYVAGLAGDAEEGWVKGDDGEGWDAYLGGSAEGRDRADRVFVVTQVKASNARYDEQKGLFGFGADQREEAQAHYLAHVHPTMFGRMGSLSLDDFHRQLAAHREAGGGVFRAETDEDRQELALMEELERAPLSDPEPSSEPDSDE